MVLYQKSKTLPYLKHYGSAIKNSNKLKSKVITKESSYSLMKILPILNLTEKWLNKELKI